MRRRPERVSRTRDGGEERTGVLTNETKQHVRGVCLFICAVLVQENWAALRRKRSMQRESACSPVHAAAVIICAKTTKSGARKQARELQNRRKYPEREDANDGSLGCQNGRYVLT